MPNSSSQKSVVLEIGEVTGTVEQTTYSQTGTSTVQTFVGCENENCSNQNVLNYNSNFSQFNSWKDMGVEDVGWIGLEQWFGGGSPDWNYLSLNIDSVNYSFNANSQNALDNLMSSSSSTPIMWFEFKPKPGETLEEFNGAEWSTEECGEQCTENRVSENRQLTEQGRMLYGKPKASSGFSRSLVFEAFEGTRGSWNGSSWNQKLLVLSCGKKDFGQFIKDNWGGSELNDWDIDSIKTAAFLDNFEWTLSPYIHGGYWNYENNAIRYNSDGGGDDDSNDKSIHCSFKETDEGVYYGSQMGGFQNKGILGIRSAGALFNNCGEQYATQGYKISITVDAITNCRLQILTYTDVNSQSQQVAEDWTFGLEALEINTNSNIQWVWQEITQAGQYDICVPWYIDTVYTEDALSGLGGGDDGCPTGRARIQTGGSSYGLKSFATNQYKFLNVVQTGSTFSGNSDLVISKLEITESGSIMAEQEIPIYTELTSSVPKYEFNYLDIYNRDQVPIALNYQSGDLTDPGKKTAGYSKTFEIPATPHNNKILKVIGGDNSVHNENAISWRDARIKTNGVVVFKGLARIEKSHKGKGNYYSCHILQDTGLWPELVGDKKLCDLAFPTHIKNYNTVVSSWTKTVDEQHYVYPAINYGKWSPGEGLSSTCANEPKLISDFHPAIFVKAIVDKIFNDIDYTIESNFFNSSRFKKMIVPYTSGNNYADLGDLFGEDGDYSGKGERSGSVSLPQVPATGYSIVYTGRKYYPILITSQGTSYMSANYTTSSCNNGYTAPFTGLYNFYYEAEVRQSQGGNQSGRWACWWHVNGQGMKQNNYGSINEESSSTYYNVDDPTYNGGEGDCNVRWFEDDSDGDYMPDSMMIEGVQLNQGDKVQIGYYGRNGSNAYGLWGNIRKQKFFVYPTPGQNFDPGGYVINTGDVLGCSVKQKDFLKGLTQMFNLYWTADDSSRKVMVEPYDDFYGSGKVVDWTKKLDNSRWTDKFLIDELAKVTRFRYKVDNADKLVERYNEWATNETNVYGEEAQLWSIDFTNEEKYRKSLTDLSGTVFSPTYEMFSNPGDETFCISTTQQAPIMPVMWSNTISFDWLSNITRPDRSYSFNIRILNYWGLSNQCGTWKLKNEDGEDIEHNTYPYAYTYNYNHSCEYNDANGPGATDNLIWYNKGGSDGTCFQRGLFDTFWNRYYEKINGGAKLRTCYMNLNPGDIAQFDFRDIIKIDLDGGNPTYWTVSKIIDYKPAADSLTKVELVEWKFELPVSGTPNSIYAPGYGNINEPGATATPGPNWNDSDGNQITLNPNINKDKEIPGTGLTLNSQGQIIPNQPVNATPKLNVTNSVTLGIYKSTGIEKSEPKQGTMEVLDSNGFSVGYNSNLPIDSNVTKSKGIALGKSLVAYNEQIVLGKLNEVKGSDIFQVGGGYYDKKLKKYVRRNSISVNEKGDFCVYGGEVVAEFKVGDVTICGDVYYTDSDGNKRKVYLEKRTDNYR